MNYAKARAEAQEKANSTRCFVALRNNRIGESDNWLSYVIPPQHRQCTTTDYEVVMPEKWEDCEPLLKASGYPRATSAEPPVCRVRGEAPKAPPQWLSEPAQPGLSEDEAREARIRELISHLSPDERAAFYAKREAARRRRMDALGSMISAIRESESK